MMNNAEHASAQARGLVEKMFAAEFAFMKSGGVDRSVLVPAFHPDVVIHEPASLPYAGDWHGLEGVSALMRRMGETWSDMSVDGLEIAGTARRAFLGCRLRLVARATGVTIQQPFAEWLRFEDGRLIEGTPFYFDTAELATAVAGAR
jgi:ketosteroid isomerase-like protein